MSALEIARLNIFSPPVLAFGAGAAAVLVRRSVRIPNAVYVALSVFLLSAIGFKGGVALAATTPSQIALPALATLALGVGTPVAVFTVLRRTRRFSTIDAAALAAHYGSVSAVTFTAAVAFLGAVSVPVEGFMPTLLAILEVPAIVVALLLARRSEATKASWGPALREVVTGRSIVLLMTGLGVGLAAGRLGMASVPPAFTQLFLIALTLFLLEMGMTAARKLGDIRSAGSVLCTFALITPVVMGTVGVLLGRLAGLSVGGTTVFAVMAASASYIAAPAAVRIALPTANPGLYLTAALGITFPFNLIIGIPLYHGLAKVVHG